MIYKIVLWANKERCDLDGYQQKIEVYFNDERKHVYSWYSEKFENKPDNTDNHFDIFVTEININAESPRAAVIKYLKWSNSGLPESYLD
jgi:hypothetical protein